MVRIYGSGRGGKLGGVGMAVATMIRTPLQWICLMAAGACLYAMFINTNAAATTTTNQSPLLQGDMTKPPPEEEQPPATVALSCPPCPSQTDHQSLATAPPPMTPKPKPLSAEECRDVFRSGGQGGVGELGDLSFCEHKNGFNVCQDLQDFTGLSEDELDKRIRRKGRFHFEGEHQFWNPTSATELAWYYSTSVDYMFANAAHTLVPIVRELNMTHAPVLDYSGGVGNNVIYLASQGIKAQYFGIGMMEFAFAEYRIRKRGMENLVEFKKPFSAQTNWKFDPINAPFPLDGSLGAILAIDVLEHIPNYHIVVKAMVDSIKIGGIIMEQSPFSKRKNDGKADLRVHVSDGGVSMEEAMGPRMRLVKNFWGTGGVWEKVSQ